MSPNELKSSPVAAQIPHIKPPMRAVWQSLAWKEWHEHKWKLVSITVISWSVAAFVQGYAFTPDWAQLATSVVALCVLPLAVFIGLATAANERSRGTMAFLQSLPVPMWRVAIWKLLLGMITFTTPILLAVAVCYVWYLAPHSAGSTQPDTADQSAHSLTGSLLGDFILSSTVCAISLFIWTAATSVNSKDEVRAGALSLAVMVGWYAILLLLGWELYHTIGGEHGWITDKSLTVLITSTAPGGISRGLAEAPDRPVMYAALGAAIAMHLALVIWYISRFGRIANLEVRSPRTAVRHSARPDWLAAPKKSPLAAIVWKQWRESGPLVLVGTAGAVGIATLLAFSNSDFYARRLDQFATLFAGTIVSIGFCVAMVVGIGVCYGDISPSINTFWRSRPVNPNTWFWGKYLTGLIVLLTLLYIPLVVVVYCVHPNPASVFLDDHAVLMPAAHLAIFAAAVATTCLVRHAVYAAILSIPVIYVGVAIVWITIWLAALIGWVHRSPANLWEMSNLQLAAGFFLSFAICTPLAWLATRNDWGQKSRY